VRKAFSPASFSERCSVLQQRSAAAFRKILDHLRTTPWQAIASRHWELFLVIGAVLVLSIIWKVPQWQVAGWQGRMEPKDLAKLQNDARTTLVQALGGAVLLIGLYFTLRNLRLTQDRQITEHYTRAVEQLGSDKLAVRLGAIYALERIARDSERDHWPIMEILTAYVREHAPWEAEQLSQEERPLSQPQPTKKQPSAPKLALDIQAILTVLGRRTRIFGRGEDQRLDLTRTALRGAQLEGAHLEWARLDGAHLEEANLRGAHLESADLWGAHLEWADLRKAHLERAQLGQTDLGGARLWEAHLQGAFLWRTHLEGADLSGAHLQRAFLWEAHLERAVLAGAYLERAILLGAHLEKAIGLTVEQLSTVSTLHEAPLDPLPREQIYQQYRRLLEKISLEGLTMVGDVVDPESYHYKPLDPE
jgi:hypothetical protein